MTFCMCGAEPSYPHKSFCPFPYFGHSMNTENYWQELASMKRMGWQIVGTLNGNKFYDPQGAEQSYLTALKTTEVRP